MTDLNATKILILDFGSQTTQLIARRLREQGVYCELVSCDVDNAFITAFQPNGIILSGSPESVQTDSPLKAPDAVFTLGVPVLGICYGMQTMATQLGGVVASTGSSEFGHAKIFASKNKPLLGASGQLDVWMSHGDHVSQLPDGFEILATTDKCPIAAMGDKKRHFYGVQFHPEVTHTTAGDALLAHFVLNICQCQPHWTLDNIVESLIAEVKSKVGNERVLLALSGGVDSSVTAAILHRAIGKQLTCVFVDNGLLRLNEVAEVEALFRDNLGMHLITVSARERFLKALSGESDPEAKRKIIGEQFIRVFEEEANKLDGIRFLAQGTIYPDVIESAKVSTGKAHVIKSHHNVGGLPDDMQLELVEPLRMLFKDEVRKLGVHCGLPAKQLYRHPFPGPGLGVRILGEIKNDYLDMLAHADDIYTAALREFDLYDEVSQAFAVFLPVKTVGVKGDARCYEYVIALRAVKTIDFMTADWAELPYTFLAEVSRRIINRVPGIARVVYDISNKPPATIEWE